MKLPWKEGHPEFPTNYFTSLRRLKSQVARLEKEPEVLWEYTSIINDQLDRGVIEKVVELEKGGGGGKCTIYLIKLLFGKRPQQRR